MRQYLVRRLLQMIPILIGVSILIFGLLMLVPGDFVDANANPSMSKEQIENLKELYGVNDPVPVRYVKWASGALTGNFGDSFIYQKPVSSVIGDFVWNSFYLAGTAFILQMLIAVPIGIISATRQYSKADVIFTILALVGISMPSFFIGLVLQKTFAIDRQWLPLSGLTTAGANFTGGAAFLDVLLHLVLPCIVLALAGVGSMMRYIRTAMLEVIRQDYIRTARAKGLAEKIVIYRHALRNAMIPIVTLIGLQIPGLFAGAIITEKLFAYPGIGRVAMDAITKRDYPLMMGFAMFLALLTLLGNLLSDILYAAVDPRIKME